MAIKDLNTPIPDITSIPTRNFPYEWLDAMPESQLYTYCPYRNLQYKPHFFIRIRKYKGVEGDKFLDFNIGKHQYMPPFLYRQV